MPDNRFYMLDVFAERRYAGNQLAVVMNAENLDDALMQQIAKEFNFSETTFVIGSDPSDKGFRVRIFTPDHEIHFAGHPTLGTAYVIREKLMAEEVDTVTLDLNAGSIPVTFGGAANGLLWMRQLPPTFGLQHPVATLATVLGLEETDFDQRFPIEEVSTGTPFFMVPLRTLAAQKRIQVNLEENARLVEANESKAILTFCPETEEDNIDLNVRVFGHWYGVPEDPATGSANGCLAGYLVKHRYFGTDSIDIKVEEGIQVGRPSLLHLRAATQESGIEVNVGGRVKEVSEGRLL